MKYRMLSPEKIGKWVRSALIIASNISAASSCVMPAALS